MYIQIDNIKYECKATTFTTQNGNEAVRVISEAPVAENGFLLLNSKEEVIADRSDFTYLYRTEGDTIKEYTKVAEEIIPAQGFVYDLPVDPVQRQISSLNRRVSEITPYEQTKKAYYGEIEKVFYGVPKGIAQVIFDNYDGEYTLTRVEDRVRIGFDEKLKEQTNITIMVQ